MSTDIKNIKKQFEKSMSDYDKNAVVQDLMASKLVIEILKISSEFENVLELGSGTGLLTQRLVKSVKYKNFYANDLVEKSKIYIDKIVPNTKFYLGNAIKIKPSQKLDLIVSNAMFQWFDNLDKAIEILTR